MHKVAFTKFEPKINLILGRPIIRQDEVFEAEGLLSTLKGDSHIVKIGLLLLIKNGNELATKIETNLLSDEKKLVSLSPVAKY